MAANNGQFAEKKDTILAKASLAKAAHKAYVMCCRLVRWHLSTHEQ
jgi:hypothetical protein